MKHAIMAILGLTLALGATGCVNGLDKEQTGVAAEQSAATLFGADMLRGLQEHNYAKFSQNFAADLRKSTPEPAFRKLCADLAGKNDKITGCKHLDTLERGGVYRTELWKVAVERKTKNSNNEIDRVFYVTTALIDGKEAVIGFKFETLF